MSHSPTLQRQFSGGVQKHGFRISFDVEDTVRGSRIQVNLI